MSHVTDPHDPNFGGVEELVIGRRGRVPIGQCAYCDREREAGSLFHPPHDASKNCRSGKREHCTCDVCF